MRVVIVLDFVRLLLGLLSQESVRSLVLALELLQFGLEDNGLVGCRHGGVQVHAPLGAEQFRVLKQDLLHFLILALDLLGMVDLCFALVVIEIECQGVFLGYLLALAYMPTHVSICVNFMYKTQACTLYNLIIYYTSMRPE